MDEEGDDDEEEVNKSLDMREFRLRSDLGEELMGGGSGRDDLTEWGRPELAGVATTPEEHSQLLSSPRGLIGSPPPR